MNGSDMIRNERARQQASKLIGGEDYGPEHDLGRADQLATAAAVYALPGDRTIEDAWQGILINVNLRRVLWPWDNAYWKPTPELRIRELVKAGALIAAAIDALLLEEERASQPASAPFSSTPRSPSASGA